MRKMSVERLSESMFVRFYRSRKFLIFIKIGAKTMLILSPVRLTFTILPWKGNILLHGRLLLFAECRKNSIIPAEPISRKLTFCFWAHSAVALSL
jgi:hypothetical protein